MRSLRYALCLVAIAFMLAMAGASKAHQRQPTERPKPDASTCVAPPGWWAKIEQTPYGWACVMRSNKRKTVRAFFY